MTENAATSSACETIWIEDGERVFPCHCGETHRGAYAVEDWAHHNCLHRSALVLLRNPDMLLCPDCGRVFGAEVEALRHLTARDPRDDFDMTEEEWDQAFARATPVRLIGRREFLIRRRLGRWESLFRYWLRWWQR